MSAAFLATGAQTGVGPGPDPNRATSSDEGLPDATPLPALREELRIHRGPPLAGGAPGWHIFDPVRHAYFQIGPAELNLLSAWSVGTVGALRVQLQELEGHSPEPGRIEALLNFLRVHHLVVLEAGQAVPLLTQQAQAQRQSPWQWLLHHYLFVRVPLLRPERFLRRTLPLVQPLFSARFAGLMLLVALTGLYFVSRQWDGFVSTFAFFFSLEGVLIYALCLGLSKSIHELGHAYAATHVGCRVSTMGVAFLVMMPVLYTDTTDVWKLRSRRQRVLVDSAGVLAELCLAAVATLLWAFLPDGPLRSATFVLATISWVATLAINLSPFMRFDGYYLLSDLVGMPNLGERSMALGRWRLRELLFGLGLPAPEPLSLAARRALVLFAWATWLYRALLFVGIALLVYHLFFKALGVLLMAVELAWFIGGPVQREVRHWWRLRAQIRRQPRSRWTLLAVLGLALASLLPLDRSVGVPAVLVAAREEPLYAPEAAQVHHLAVRAGQAVVEGELLVVLSSPELMQAQREAAIRLNLLQARVARSAADRKDRAQLQELSRAVQAEQEHMAGLAKRQQRLHIRAPYAGRVADLDSQLRVGQWLHPRQLLARVVDPIHSADLRGYVEAQEAWRVQAGASGRFIPDSPGAAAFAVQLSHVSAVAAESIELPYLQSTHGGPIAVQKDERGRSVPVKAQHPVILQPWPDAAPNQTQVLRGVVHLDARGESVLAKAVRQLMRVLARETGV